MVRKLPRAPRDSGIVVFQVPNAEGDPMLQRVRKHAVMQYLAVLRNFRRTVGIEPNRVVNRAPQSGSL